MRSTNDKQTCRNVQIQTAAVLPKLHQRINAALGNSEKYENITNYKKNANLPTIKKQEMNVEQRSVKNHGDRRKIFMMGIFN